MPQKQTHEFSRTSKAVSMQVKAKKHLGQHFLKDENVAKKIADSLRGNTYKNVLEIGPGTGVLTKYLLQKEFTTYAIEIDTEAVDYLKNTYPSIAPRILSQDFLSLSLSAVFKKAPIAIIGNFPYNISSQIVFKTLENRAQIPEFAGMFQKEVAERIAEREGSKKYGILSVLVQAFYDVEYLFTVPPGVFDPPPKVESGVIRMVRKENSSLPVDEKLFFRVVKTAFNQRRKMLRKSLKSMHLSDKLREGAIFAKRPEQLSVAAFIELTSLIERDAN